MISVDSSQLIFDFLTQADLAQEIVKGPSSALLNGEVYLVAYGSNLPKYIVNANGGWIHNFYEQTDHWSYTLKQTLSIKLKASIKRDNSASTVKCRVRLLLAGQPTGSELSRNIEPGNGATTFTWEPYTYPISFSFLNARIEHGGSYTAQVKFEEWLGGNKIGETVWLSSTHVMKARLRSPSLTVALSDTTFTNETTFMVTGDLSGDYAYVGVRKDLEYGLGSVGTTFSVNGSDLVIVTPTSRKYSIPIQTNGVSQKFRIAVAAKDEFGCVTNKPILKDICFDYDAPITEWVSITQTGTKVILRTTATDSFSGVNVTSGIFKNATYGLKVTATYLGQGLYEGEVGVFEKNNLLVFEVSDKAGNTRSMSKTVTIDTTKPTISCQDVAVDGNNQTQMVPFVDGMTLNSGSTAFKFLAQDAGSGISQIKVQINGTVYTHNFTGQQSVTCMQPASLILGNNTIKATAIDKSGTTAEANYVVKYALPTAAAPTITVVSPAYNSRVDNDNVVMTGAVQAPNGLKKVRLEIMTPLYGGLPYAWALGQISGGVWTAALSGLYDGTANIDVIAEDNAGLEGRVSHRLQVGEEVVPEPPPITIKPTVISIHPADGSTGVSPTATVKVTFSKPMNTTIAKQAVSILPQTYGTWSWSDGNRALEFSHTTSFSGASVQVSVDSSAQDDAGNQMETSYYSYFSIAQQPYVVSVLPNDGAPLSSDIVISFSTLMNRNSFGGITLRELMSGVAVSYSEKNVSDSMGGTVLTLQPSALKYGTVYEVVVPTTVKSSDSLAISEHRHVFLTEQGSTGEVQGATITLLPGLNGLSVPMNVAEIKDDSTLRSYLNTQLFSGATGTIFRYNAQLGKWVASVQGGTGNSMGFGEGIVVAMNISSAQQVRFVGTAHESGKNIVVNKGLNCIGVPRRISASTAKDIAGELAQQLGANELVMYMFRRKQGTRKVAVGYAYRQPRTHDGIMLDTGEEQLAGDAILFISHKSGYVRFYGESWED